MEKVVLIDGNNLIFRSYYATAYTGNIMRNSKGLATNALYGLCNMLLKIEKEEKPDYVLVAFDKGKTFRHEMFDDYKDGRSETPDDLKKQIEFYETENNELNSKYKDLKDEYNKLAFEKNKLENLLMDYQRDEIID